MTARSERAVTDFSARQDPAAAHCTRRRACKLCRSGSCEHKYSVTAPQSPRLVRTERSPSEILQVKKLCFQQLCHSSYMKS
ncbi:uncharacterized protein V6R79_016123 [Siganus canaliculatus]